MNKTVLAQNHDICCSCGEHYDWEGIKDIETPLTNLKPLDEVIVTHFPNTKVDEGYSFNCVVCGRKYIIVKLSPQKVIVADLEPLILSIEVEDDADPTGAFCLL